METLSDTIFTGASSALPPEKPHRQRRAVLQTTIYLPTRCLRATSLQGKDPGHLLPEEISQLLTSKQPTAVHFNSLGRSAASAPALTSEGLAMTTSMAPGTCSYEHYHSLW